MHYKWESVDNYVCVVAFMSMKFIHTYIHTSDIHTYFWHIYILLTCHTVMRNPEIICFNWRVNAEQNLLNVRGPADWCFSQSLVSAIWNLLAILTKEENVKIQFAIITRHVHSVRDADPQLHLQAFLSKPFEAPPLLWIPPWKLTALVLLNCDMVHDSSSWDGW